jgi:protein-disulfide isomerase
LVEYADLECPYCRAYFPVLRQWIDAHPEVNWQWHHLPLSIHDPAATRAAMLAECAGEIGGNRTFWDALAFLYQHTEEVGAGLPAFPTPVLSKAIQDCVRAGRVQSRVKAAADAAVREGITVTPTLQLLDRDTHKTLTLWGPMPGDALLSGIDLLSSDRQTDPSSAAGIDVPQ